MSEPKLQAMCAQDRAASVSCSSSKHFSTCSTCASIQHFRSVLREWYVHRPTKLPVAFTQFPAVYESLKSSFLYLGRVLVWRIQMFKVAPFLLRHSPRLHAAPESSRSSLSLFTSLITAGAKHALSSWVPICASAGILGAISFRFNMCVWRFVHLASPFNLIDVVLPCFVCLFVSERFSGWLPNAWCWLRGAARLWAALYERDAQSLRLLKKDCLVFLSEDRHRLCTDPQQGGGKLTSLHLINGLPEWLKMWRFRWNKGPNRSLFH